MADETPADQKTEAPTARRVERALEEGQVAFSSELLSGLLLLTGMFFLLLMGKWFFDALRTVIRERITFTEGVIAYPETLLLAVRRDLMQAGAICAALMIPLISVLLMAGFLQTRFNISFKPLVWNWGRLRLSNGMKRIFSTRSLNRGGIALAKAGAIGVAIYFITRARLGEIAAAGQTTLIHAVEVGGQLILAIGFLAAALMVVVGMIDYAFQYWKQQQDLRMSLQEVRDENKELEGDPLVKARIRRVANEMSRRRTLSKVPEATVVVTNPTHFAVALKYDPDVSDAPLVIAKGADHLAQQIIKVAKEHGVAVVERKPVARYLYANVKEGQPIPFEMFQAVAEILNFIRTLGDRAA